MYEFKFPTSGTVVTWKPLARKQKVSIMASLVGGSNAAYVGDSLMAARIVSVNGAPLAHGVFSMSDYQDLADDAELGLFEEHVIQQEALRLSNLREKANVNPSSLKERIESAINQFEIGTQQMATAFKLALDAAEALAAGADPLGSKQS